MYTKLGFTRFVVRKDDLPFVLKMPEAWNMGKNENQP